MDLTHDEILRYSRHLTLPEVGVDGQRRLKQSRVLCIGMGGLGSPAALYLAAAGVGTLGLVDFDDVDASNLQRQIIHGTEGIGRSKLESAAKRLRSVNPHVQLELHDIPVTAANIASLVGPYDVVLDGTDNFTARYLVNDACVLGQRPNAYGSIFRFEGQASVFAAPGGPCYRCLHPEPPPPGLIPSCAEAGVLGVLPGIIGTIQATEALKLILGIGEPLIGRLLIYDALRMRFRDLKLAKDPDCPVCGQNPTITTLREYEGYCDPVQESRKTMALRDADRADHQDADHQDGRQTDRGPSAPAGAGDITVAELKSRMDRGDAPRLVDVREPREFEICRIPGAILIPLGELTRRAGELDPDAEVVLQCKSGVRSARAVAALRQLGFARPRNLVGGILAWIDEVDPTLPKY